jgi:uncharacterized membrane protein YdfJ with MMPL/SSD domain
LFASLAGVAQRRPRSICLLALIFFVVAAALGGSVAKRLDPYGDEVPGSESLHARKALEHAGLRAPAVVMVLRDAPTPSHATERRVFSLMRRLERLPHVSYITNYYTTGNKTFIAKDGNSTYMVISFDPLGEKQWQEAGEAVAERFGHRPGLIVGGAAVVTAQVNHQVEDDLRTAELLAFPLLLLLSLLFFRSLVAALLPLMIGGLAIVGTFLILRIASELGSISVFALNLTTALGLGLAIDYSLFIVSRYREEIAKTGPGLTALQRVLATAGRTVFFSSLTVAAAMASLLVFPQRFLYSMGLGGALVTLFAALISLTVLPAVLTLLGTRINAAAPRFLQQRAAADARASQAGFWYRLSRFVMRRPTPVATASALLLIVLGLPFLGIKFDAVDATVLPKSASARLAYETVNRDFPPYRESPTWIAVESRDRKSLQRFAREVRRRVPDIAEVEPVRFRPKVAALLVISNHPFVSEASQEIVQRIRALPPPPHTRILVGGATAQFLDFQSSLAAHLPYAIVIVIVATLVILFLMTGSVVLPIKSLIMNLLNLSAVFGLLVLIFQDGRLEGLLSYTSPGALQQTIPILIGAVAIGLSTDYAVFLLSRIQEARDAGLPNSEAVATGLERTGRIVTAAALLFATAMGAFATSKIVFIKENGVGIALAVLIDASIIRALLVPSLMALLGRWNWWAPRPLRRLHERWGVEEEEATAEPTP